ncbi:MAG: ParB/RepB/Spo0J family partition protein [Anaerolineales bacterium]|nr:MAG: ParB/RepB/Spo0J family partition protein [Anaerolineales bacterium]
MSRKGGLGRGLDALIPRSDQPSHNEITHIRVDRIMPNPRQPRAKINTAEIAELADSIREHGLIQPLVVSYDEANQQFVLIAGERRLRAARQAGLSSVPVIVREATDQQRLELALIENLQRLDLNPLEAAEAYRQLVEDFQLSHEEISKRVGKNRTTVTNTLRLLKLSNAVQKALMDNIISEGHARALLGLSSPQAQDAALQTILARDLNVRQTEELVRKLGGQQPRTKFKTMPNPEILAIEEKLRNQLGTKVRLHPRNKGGTLIIHYYSDEDLESLLNTILGE